MRQPASVFRRALFIIPFLLHFTHAMAQNLPGKRDSLHSDILNEERVIQVLLPENYKPGSEEKYDVLYILDGDSNMKSISAIQQFAQAESYMPPIILVAVFNTNRDRDLLPTHVGPKPSGGAGKFLSFFKNELIPYVNKTYPTNGNNILFGHSFGGVFSTYALLNEPQLFNSYLAVDPSFWWDSGYMNKLAADKLSASVPRGKALFIAGRAGEGLKEMAITGMDAILQSKAPQDLKWKIVAYADETHGSVRLKSVYDGLRFFYDGYSNKPIEFHPMNGVVLKDKPYKIYYFGSSQSVRYTTDGSEPAESSTKMGAENDLINDTKIFAKSVGRNDRYNKVSIGEFKVGKTLAASAMPKSAKPGGLHYSYYEGEWDALPDFEKLKALQSGITNKDFDVNRLPRQTNFACLIEGYIEIQKAGYYIFALDSDDGSKLYLGENLLISYDGLHGDGSPKTYLIPLEKGFYPIRMEYFQKAGGAHLKLQYVVPGEEKPRPISIPFELQYSRH
ncbi:hypothetical protein ASC95_15585 [Pelomonas sp. Root1217]|uniref:alpha/beta hydrolase-fold protein n=1 Tax=Pelomonas sp. Root1217 TaxID=1736430 RepID=UPI00070AF106|nr:alpha/beta hydrolase-fold protein [Pelomonas sp. Root1217]KQV50767.1 hypothetical protein ASC95_15585 [Pelomonas sp. Root1217]